MTTRDGDATYDEAARDAATDDIQSLTRAVRAELDRRRVDYLWTIRTSSDGLVHDLEERLMAEDLVPIVADWTLRASCAFDFPEDDDADIIAGVARSWLRRRGVYRSWLARRSPFTHEAFVNDRLADMLAEIAVAAWRVLPTDRAGSASGAGSECTTTSTTTRRRRAFGPNA